MSKYGLNVKTAFHRDMVRARIALQTDVRLDGQTDGTTYTKGRRIYVFRRGKHIITSYYCLIKYQQLPL